VKAVLRLLRRPATGAVAGQAGQAVAGLALQVVAARELGAAGLATFSVVYGAMVLATAVCSGLVGDSLTVLDRHRPDIRAGLHVGAVAVSAVAALLGGVLALATDLVPAWVAPLLGLATAAFILEDTLRRLLMATGRFWSLTLVDGSALVLGLGVLAAAATSGPLTLTSFVLAVLVGQTGAAVVAWGLLPTAERPRGPWRRPALTEVAAFGSWRALAQTIRPAMLTLLRLVVIGAAGAAAYGPLEVARVYTAPTLVLVAGMGSFLLPHFVALRPQGAAAGLRSADRAALGLTLGVAGICVVALAGLPWLGPLLTGGGYAVPVAAVAGWSVYAAASATLLPYSSLASVHGRQRQVLLLRSLEFTSLLAVLVLLLAGGDGGATWTPLALALGPLLTAVAVRQWVLAPWERSGQPMPVPVAA
jgi:O-antigen/teichoic acid export membrane protein